MDEVPYRVTIVVPTYVDNTRGRYSSVAPGSRIQRFRCTKLAIDAVTRACKLIDPKLTRNMFMRLAVERVAFRICDHHDAYLRMKREEQENARSGIGDAVQYPEGTDLGQTTD